MYRIHGRPPDWCQASTEAECHNQGAISATFGVVSIGMDCEKVRTRDKWLADPAVLQSRGDGFWKAVLSIAGLAAVQCRSVLHT